MSGPADDDRIPETVAPLPLPDFEFDDLEKQERIGTGGDADVYRATIDHDGYTYPVAVKEPRFEGTIQKRVLEKFQSEAETWSKLNDHDNVVSVYTWGAEPLPWLALEYMDGGTLQRKVGAVDLPEALWLAGRIAEGVRHGHRHGVAHLDIKPTNVLLRDTGAGTWDYPKVSDWGLAKLLLEHSNSIDGISPTYAAPEQFDAETYGEPDDITDVYQLGAVVYALVAGEPPFSGTSTAVMRGVLQDDPDPPSVVNPDVPPTVDEVVLRALAKEKPDRYEGVLTFRQELDRLFEDCVADESTGAYATGAAASGASGSSVAPDSRRSGDTGQSDDAPPVPEREQGHTTGSNQGAASTGTRGRTSSTDTTDRGTFEEDSSLVTRRGALGVLGLGVLGGGGLLGALQLTSGDEQTGAAPASTETPTPEREGDDVDGGSSGRTPESTPSPSPDSTSMAVETATQTDTESDAGTDVSFTFEDGDMAEWENIIWDDKSASGRGTWSVTSDAISGEASLLIESDGDPSQNTIATTRRVLDGSRDFDVSFTFWTPDSANRGPFFGLLTELGSDFRGETAEQPANGDGLRVHVDGNLSEQGDLQFSGDSFASPDLETDTAHEFTIRKRGGTATLSLDGSEVGQSDVDLPDSYRPTLSASGAWGGASTAKYDDIEIVYR